MFLLYLAGTCQSPSPSSIGVCSGSSRQQQICVLYSKFAKTIQYRRITSGEMTSKYDEKMEDENKWVLMKANDVLRYLRGTLDASCT